jgi:hypothetical protein
MSLNYKTFYSHNYFRIVIMTLLITPLLIMSILSTLNTVDITLNIITYN